MRRGLLLLVMVAGAMLPAPGASAAELPDSFTPSCPTENGDNSYGGVRICSGSVPSWDEVRLDVDLTQPTTGGGKHPLIIMLHGFGNDKHEWESIDDEADHADKYHWNNHWFAKHGYYVLNYTARGFKDDGPSETYEPHTPFDPNGSANWPEELRATLHLKSRDWEIRDTQWLAALVAKAYPDVDPSRIAVTGGSYGGIESWLQASQATWTFPSTVDPSLPVLELQVAVPKYPSTDLAYSLAPNGHGGGPGLDDFYESSQGRLDSDTGDGNPIGVPKQSYVTGLFALGESKGFFEKGTSTDAPFPCTYGDCEGQINIEAWKLRTDAGDPTSPEGPIIREIRRGLTEFRGAYYQDEGWEEQIDDRKVAVFSIQGWTDDLFEAVESFRMFKYLKRLDPYWPVEVALGDVGHSRAQNRPDTWHWLNNQANQWLDSNINRSHEQQTTVSSEATVCGDGARQRVVGRTPEDLANHVLELPFPPGESVSTAELADLNGPATDAIAGPQIQPGEPCRHSEGAATGGYTAYSPPFTSTETYVGLGHVRVPYTWEGVETGMLAARVFDAPPDGGKELLVTRGVYRLEGDPQTGVIRLPLYGNHWRIEPGHRLRLDLTQVDTPTYRPSNEQSAMQFGPGVTLVLPTR